MATAINLDAVYCVDNRRWRVRSRTTAGVEYVVVRLANGQLQCDCQAALNGRTCWHTRSVEATEAEQRPSRPAVDLAPGLALLTGQPVDAHSMSNPLAVAGGAFVLNMPEL